MRILYFHQHFSTPSGASGIRSFQMAKQLVASGHQVTMVCGSYEGGNTGLTGSFQDGVRTGDVAGFRVIELEIAYSNSQSFVQRTLAFLHYAWRSVKLTFTEDYDLLFATTTPLTAAIPGIIAKWFRRKPFVFEVRDLWPELPREMGVITNPIILGAMGILEWLGYRNADGLIALSPGIKEGIVRRGVSAENVALIPNGCDLSIFDTDEPSAKSWQPEGIDSDDFLAIYTGTHGIANGLDNILNAARILQDEKRDDIKILLIGRGKLKQDLIDQAKELGLTNVVFENPVNKEKLAMLMNRANVGLQVLANIPAFYYGTSPNKFFDYISAGLPVITNYPGWIADLINQSGCGIAVLPEQPQAFADALKNLADNKQKLPLMSQQARILAESEFDRDKLASEFVLWLEQWNKQHA